MIEVVVRPLTNDDWELYKTIRLRSLLDSPDAYSSTYEREYEFADQEWIDRVSGSCRVSQTLPLIAELDGKAIGIACGIVHSEDDDTAKIYQMWVQPDKRGQGIGKLLLNRLLEWAESAELDKVELTVTTNNDDAVRFYRCTGFTNIGELEPLRSGSELSVQNMVFKVGAHAS